MLSAYAVQQLVTKAAIALRAKDPAGALEALKPAPPTADTLYLAGLAYSAIGDWKAGDEAFRKARPLSSRPGEVLINHGNMLRRAGRLHDALECYQDAEGEPGATPQLDYLTSLTLHGLKRTLEAKKRLVSYTDKVPQDVIALNLLGNIEKSLGQHRDAAAAFDRALELKPDFAVARCNRAGVARHLGDLEAERYHIDRALQDAPHHPDIVAEGARAAARCFDRDAAIDLYSRAIAASPNRADLYAEFARFRWEIKDQEGFLDHYNTIPEGVADAERALILSGAGTLAIKANQNERARGFFERVLAASPRHPVALAGTAQTCPDDEREQHWKRALELASEEPTVRLGYVWFLLNQARAEEAELVLRETSAPGSEQLVYAYDSTAARMLGRERYQAYYDLDRVTAQRQLVPPVKYGGLSSFLEAIEEALEALFTHDVAPIDQTLFGGQQTPGSLLHASSPALQDLRKALLFEASRFWRELRVPLGHPLYRESKGELRMAGAWGVKLTSGGGHTDHVHPAGLFSSANYIKIPPSIGLEEGSMAGCLRLGRPNLDTIEMAPERVIKPEPGMLVFFPSYMWHGVAAFEAETPRISAPADFNV